MLLADLGDSCHPGASLHEQLYLGEGLHPVLDTCLSSIQTLLASILLSDTFGTHSPGVSSTPESSIQPDWTPAGKPIIRVYLVHASLHDAAL